MTASPRSSYYRYRFGGESHPTGATWLFGIEKRASRSVISAVDSDDGPQILREAFGLPLALGSNSSRIVGH